MNRVFAIDWGAPYKVAPTQAGPYDAARVLLVIEDARFSEINEWRRSGASSFRSAVGVSVRSRMNRRSAHLGHALLT